MKIKINKQYKLDENKNYLNDKKHLKFNLYLITYY